MSEKCCGNCKYFKDEDVNGEGFCEVKYEFEGCCHECDNHEFRNNGWTEITPDNEHELTDKLIGRAVIGWLDSCNRQHIVAFADCAMGVGTMAKYGGYYYYVLPELKIDNEQAGTNQAI
jgi:hypothetical protein